MDLGASEGREGLSEKGRVRAWQAICHDLIGAATSVEHQLDFALSAAHCGDLASLRRLHESVFPRLGADVKRRLLGDVLEATTSPNGVPATVYLPWCLLGVERLVRMRNVMAHREVVTASTDDTVHLRGYRRGTLHVERYSLAEVNYARGDLATAVWLDLRVLARWNAAPLLWGSLDLRAM